MDDQQQPQQQIEQQEDEEEDITQFIELLNSEQVCDPRFKYLRHRSKFQLKNLEKSKNPEGVLKKLLRQAIDQAIEESKEKTGTPDRFGLRISSERLKRGDFNVNFDPINANTLDSIMNRLHKVSKSAEEESIIGAPFTIEVTTICFDDLCKEVGQRQTPIMAASGTANVPRKRKCDVLHAVFEDGLLKIRNRDNYCVFHAVEMARKDKTMGNRSEFKNYRRSLDQQRVAVNILLDAIRAPKKQPFYDAGEYLPRIQEYYVQIYPGEFRIFVFGKYGQYKPLFKSGDMDNRIVLALYYDDVAQHFDVIPTITSFFGGINQYCYACERPFRKIDDHKMKCKQLCIHCRGIG